MPTFTLNSWASSSAKWKRFSGRLRSYNPTCGWAEILDTRATPKGRMLLAEPYTNSRIFPGSCWIILGSTEMYWMKHVFSTFLFQTCPWSDATLWISNGSFWGANMSFIDALKHQPGYPQYQSNSQSMYTTHTKPSINQTKFQPTTTFEVTHILIIVIPHTYRLNSFFHYYI